MAQLSLQQVQDELAARGIDSKAQLASLIQGEIQNRLSAQQPAGLQWVPQNIQHAIGASPLAKMAATFERSPEAQLLVGLGKGIGAVPEGLTQLATGHDPSVFSKGSSSPWEFVGEGLGNIGSYTLGAGALGTGLRALEGVPALGKGAQMLGKDTLLNRMGQGIAGGAVYGGASSPSDPRLGAAIGAGLGGGLGAGGEVLRGIGNLKQYLNPTQQTGNFLKGLSEGEHQFPDAKERNAKKIALQLSNIYGKIKAPISDEFNNIKNTLLPEEHQYGTNATATTVGDSRLYNPGLKEEITKDLWGLPTTHRSEVPLEKVWEEGKYGTNLPQDLTDRFPLKLKRQHENFTTNPSVDNAHKLQTNYLEEIRPLENLSDQKRLGVDDRQYLSYLKDSQKNLLSDITDHLHSIDPQLATQYRGAKRLWAQEVIPWHSHNTLVKMITPKRYSGVPIESNPKPTELASVFSAPNSDMNKVIDTLPGSLKNRILYSQLDNTGKIPTPSVVTQGIKRLQNKGWGGFITPEVYDNLNHLNKIEQWSKALQNIPGALLAAKLASSVMPGPADALIGGMAGLKYSAPFMKSVGETFPPAVRKVLKAPIKAITPALKYGTITMTPQQIVEGDQ